MGRGALWSAAPGMVILLALWGFGGGCQAESVSVPYHLAGWPVTGLGDEAVAAEPVDLPLAVVAASRGRPWVRRIEAPPGAGPYRIDPDRHFVLHNWTRLLDAPWHFVDDEGRSRSLETVAPHTWPLLGGQGARPELPVREERIPLHRDPAEPTVLRPERAIAIPAGPRVELLCRGGQPGRAVFRIPENVGRWGGEREQHLGFSSTPDEQGVWIAREPSLRDVALVPGWQVVLSEPDDCFDGAELRLRWHGASLVVPDGVSGWLFYGGVEDEEARRSTSGPGAQPAAEQPPTAPDPAGLPVADPGPPLLAPGVHWPLPLAFAEEPPVYLGQQSDEACPGVLLPLPALYEVAVLGFPASSLAVGSLRTLELRDRSDGQVTWQAWDGRELGQSDLPGRAETLRVRWRGALARQRVLDLVEAARTGLHCTGEAEAAPVQDGPALVFRGVSSSVVARAAQGGGWLLEDTGSGRVWAAADRGFSEALQALGEELAEPGVAAWSEVTSPCPPPIDERAEPVALELRSRGTAWASGGGTELALQRRGEVFGFEAISRRWGSSGAGPARRWSGEVDGALVRALLDAVRVDVRCDPFAEDYEPMSDRSSSRGGRLALDRGHAVRFASKSQQRDGAPWEIRVGDFGGTQEDGSIGRAVRAVFDAAEALAPERAAPLAWQPGPPDRTRLVEGLHDSRTSPPLLPLAEILALGRGLSVVRRVQGPVGATSLRIDPDPHLAPFVISPRRDRVFFVSDAGELLPLAWPDKAGTGPAAADDPSSGARWLEVRTLQLSPNPDDPQRWDAASPVALPGGRHWRVEAHIDPPLATSALASLRWAGRGGREVFTTPTRAPEGEVAPPRRGHTPSDPGWHLVIRPRSRSVESWPPPRSVEVRVRASSQPVLVRGARSGWLFYGVPDPTHLPPEGTTPEPGRLTDLSELEATASASLGPPLWTPPPVGPRTWRDDLEGSWLLEPSEACAGLALPAPTLSRIRLLGLPVEGLPALRADVPLVRGSEPEVVAAATLSGAPEGAPQGAVASRGVPLRWATPLASRELVRFLRELSGQLVCTGEAGIAPRQGGARLTLRVRGGEIVVSQAVDGGWLVRDERAGRTWAAADQGLERRMLELLGETVHEGLALRARLEAPCALPLHRDATITGLVVRDAGPRSRATWVEPGDLPPPAEVRIRPDQDGWAFEGEAFGQRSESIPVAGQLPASTTAGLLEALSDGSRCPVSELGEGVPRPLTDRWELQLVVQLDDDRSVVAELAGPAWRLYLDSWQGEQRGAALRSALEPLRSAVAAAAGAQLRP